MPPTRIILGLMSGTSVDAIDVAVVRIRGTTPRLVPHTLHLQTYRWPAALRTRLLAAMAPARTTTQEICRLNTEVSWHFARAALQALRAAKIPPAKITALASHGQTLCHLPPEGSRGQGVEGPRGTAKNKSSRNDVSLSAFRIQNSAFGSTLQLGDPSIIATLTGIPTIGNFRAADMALGGQGAPLVPWTDAILFQHQTKARCVQNIGGIANVTYLPPVASGRPIRAFDTGPGNMLIDAVVSLATNGHQTFDRGGAIAARGQIQPRLFHWLQARPYFDRPPPKSTGREEFGLALAQEVLARSHNLRVQDCIATVTYLTAWSIADAYFNFLPGPPHEVILCGGGGANTTLVRMLHEQLHATAPEHPIPLTPIDDLGIPNKAKEALSFALLGAATLDHAAANLPTVTGAARPTVLGVIAYPR